MIKKYKKYFIGYIVIITLLVFNNVFLPMLNSGIYYPSEALPSQLCTEGARIADNTLAGYLTFGPYVSVEAQKIYVDVFYKTDSDNNTVDVYSGTLDKIFASEKLDLSRDKMRIEADITEDIADLEIRTFYQGQGYLSVEGIMLLTRQNDLFLIIIIYDVIYLAILITISISFIRKLKNKIGSEVTNVA